MAAEGVDSGSLPLGLPQKKWKLPERGPAAREAAWTQAIFREVRQLREPSASPLGLETVVLIFSFGTPVCLWLSRKHHSTFRVSAVQDTPFEIVSLLGV